MIEFVFLSMAEYDLLNRCMRAGILDKKPDHPLARFIAQAHRARHYAAVCASGEGPHPQEKLVQEEARKAAALLTEWRKSEHHHTYIQEKQP